jgi:hypothetical protein
MDVGIAGVKRKPLLNALHVDIHLPDSVVPKE